MARSSNGSPIARLSDDQLLSILLLLPTSSILSFSLTCRRFRSLACSDTLWESVCRRDWGIPCVDSIKPCILCSPSSSGDRWMKLYRRVVGLDEVGCRRLGSGDEAGARARARASHSMNFVGGCLVVFGGGCEGGHQLDDTWVACLGKDCKTVLMWQKTSSGFPSGRFGHTSVVIGDSLIVFGGINDRGARLNDTWIGRVIQNEAFIPTLLWRPLEVGPSVPPSRGAHAACTVTSRKMLIFGGIGSNGLRLGDTWILDLAENLNFGTWHEAVMHPSPPPRSGHTLTCIDGTRAVLFGGRGSGYEVLNDVWLFDTSLGRLKWKPLYFDLKAIPGGVSLPRVGHSAVVIIGGRVLVYGGEDSDRRRKNDFWLLDVNSIPSFKGCSFSASSKALMMWRKLKTGSYKPNPRSFHAACTDYSGRFMYVFGGMVDGLVFPADPCGLRFDAELFVAELVLHPEK
ncbi:F-box/kelch-repeat protein-like protein [Drosera capensis]